MLVQKRLPFIEPDSNQPKLNLSNVQIYNCANVGLLGRDAQITATNMAINYCGQASLAATLGGAYNFTHCTFNNNWNSSKQFAVVVGNYIETSEATYISDLTQANFTKWEEKIISVSDDELVLENEAKITYYYKKFVPYSKRK